MLLDSLRQSRFYENLVLRPRGLAEWRKRGYSENAPQFVKQLILSKYGSENATWIETGTFLGKTTQFLARNASAVYTIEPEPSLYARAKKRFENTNITVINDVSEKAFPELLPKISGKVNFWLDGHYSAGVTFKGDTDCPVADELKAIAENLAHFTDVAILIDDVRCFLPSAKSEYADYPSIDYLVDWAREHKFIWRIEHDIFIMQNRPYF